MDALTILMTLMLTVNEPCTELPAHVTEEAGEKYLMETYHCGDTTVRVWSFWCHADTLHTPRGTSQGYWSRPFLLEDDRTSEGIYLNRFAELQAGWHVALDDVYRPACGV